MKLPGLVIFAVSVFALGLAVLTQQKFAAQISIIPVIFSPGAGLLKK
jgi:hypothetical protein